MPKQQKSQKQDSGAWVTLGELVREAIPSEWRMAEEELRTTTYTKEGYWQTVFPDGLFQIDDKPDSGSDYRKIMVLSNQKGRTFVRNLWFLHMFFGMPKRVIKFLKTDAAEQCRLFDSRLAQLEVTSGQYLRCFAAAAEVRKKLDGFSAVSTDLYSCVRGSSTTEPSAAMPQVGWRVAIVDFIRQVEERASYKAGAPEDSCEQALYFLELGRADIAENIAREVLEEHTENPVALYTNAVLLVESSKRHRQEAFTHETIHDPSLTPVTAEEQWHVDRHDDVMLKAWQASEDAFHLLLRAWKHWPDKFKISAWRLSPELWREQIENLVLRKAAFRLANGAGGFSLTNAQTAQEEKKILGELVRHIAEKREKYLCKPFSVPALRDFIIVTASLWPEGGRTTLEKLAVAVAKDLDQLTVWWHDLNGVELPISEDPTLCEALLGLGSDKPFCHAVVQLFGAPAGIALIQNFEKKSELRRKERDLARRSLIVREIVAGLRLDIQGLSEGLGICRCLVHEYEAASTPLTVSLRCWWRYSVIRLLFEASCLHAQAGASGEAISKAEEALGLAKSWFVDISNPRTMVRFMDQDEDSETETVGDWLRLTANIITDPESLGRSGSGPGWRRAYSVALPTQFTAWLADGHAESLPLLAAYAQWLSAKYGEAAIGLASRMRESGPPV